MVEEPIWVLHLCNELIVGGDRTFLINYYKYMDRNKIQFAFAIQRDFNIDTDSIFLDMGGRVHSTVNMNKNIFKYVLGIVKLLHKHPEYKIVHAHMNHRNAIPMLICKFMGIRIRISHAHTKGNIIGHIAKVRVKLMKLINAAFATELFACSEEAGRYLYKRKKYSVINNAIDVEKFRYSKQIRNLKRNEWGLSNKTILGHIGNFSKIKNYELILNILSKLSDNYHLVLVGDGDRKTEIVKAAEKMSLMSRITFLGLQFDIPEILQGFDVFIFPSKREGLGIVAIEAQAAGLYTICSDAIPQETKITKFIRYISLSDPISNWIKAIDDYKNHDRVDTSTMIRDSGYDIVENARKLEKIYIKLYKIED